MNNSLYYNKWHKIVYCDNYIRTDNRINILVGKAFYYSSNISQYRNIDEKLPEIIVYYNNKYYHSVDYSIRLDSTISGCIEVMIKNLVDITRDYNINIILDE